MSRTEVRVIDAYVFIKTKSGLKYLLLKRAEEKIYGGLWQCVTGKIEADEPACMGDSGQGVKRRNWANTIKYVCGRSCKQIL